MWAGAPHYEEDRQDIKSQFESNPRKEEKSSDEEEEKNPNDVNHEEEDEESESDQEVTVKSGQGPRTGRRMMKSPRRKRKKLKLKEVKMVARKKLQWNSNATDNGAAVENGATTEVAKNKKPWCMMQSYESKR